MEEYMMMTFEQILFQIVAELPISEFNKACEKAGIDEKTKQDLLNLLHARGV